MVQYTQVFCLHWLDVSNLFIAEFASINSHRHMKMKKPFLIENECKTPYGQNGLNAFLFSFDGMQ